MIHAVRDSLPRNKGLISDAEGCKMTQARDVQEMLGLRAPPIAVAFLTEPPVGVAPWRGPAQPAGCAFWRKAQDGESFYTVPADHFNCAVGAYTHAIDLPPDRKDELSETIGLMAENGYIEMAEVPDIPRLASQPAVVAYGPADPPAFPPQLVLLSARPAQAMLIYETALRIGVTTPLTNLLGRPTCAVLPLTLNDQHAAVSLGCAGNRLHTGLPEDEIYIAIPGDSWQVFKSKLAEIVGANAQMNEHYRSREESLGTST
jgi:uncharacterized protein (DUF169 family)